ncbi:MAG: apolipoprotein N-acyltransferase [Bacteroidota bacterium]
MKKFSNWFLALGSSILLWASWPVSPFTFLIFTAWVPLLWLESKVKSRRKFFGYTYITMFTWNVATTWWVWNASEPGATAAFLANSLLMCFPWLGFKIAKKWLGEKTGYVALIVFWISFEYIHLHDWGLSWPWLTLGNVFATHTEWIQWYKYTGTSGGSLWIMIINVLLFLHLKNNFNREADKTYKNLLAAILLMVIPVTISIFSSVSKKVIGDRNVVIVQPNIDPYEKISAGSFDAQLQTLIQLSEKEIDANTALVIWPETALYTENFIDETRMKEYHSLQPMWAFLQRHPDISLFSGVESFRVFDSPLTSTAKPVSGGRYIDSYNGSVLMDSSGVKAYYHKSMLVPGVETLPWFLKFMDTWFEKFGGTTAGYAKQDERTVLKDEKHGYKIAPSICFESIYGEFMSKYIAGGANIICVITNDGWWGNTPGYKQHMNYSRLRAVETGTWVAHCANTGISCFIDPRGNIINPQPWDMASSIKMNVPFNDTKTFYVKYGDLLSKGMLLVSIIIIITCIVLWIKKKLK